MSEFGPIDSLPLYKHRKLDDKKLPLSVSIDLLDDVLSLESSHTSPSKDEQREDLSYAESFESSSEVRLSSSTSVSGDDDSSSSKGSDRPFILPNDWEVNKHCSSLSDKRLFKIRFEFQIPHNVPTRLSKDGEKCYSHDGEGVGFYEAPFTSELRLPLNHLSRRLLQRLGIAISQLALNSWRTFIGAQVLWGIISEGQETLSLNEFLYCYKPIRVPKVKGMYYFKCKKEECKLVTEVPSSNRDWKRKFFFVNRSNRVCSPKEVGGVQPIDCTWGVLPKSGESSV